MAIIGYDLSHWEYPEVPAKWADPVDLAASVAGGMRFAYYKATHGMGVDRTYAKFTEKPLPFPFGAFHWYLELGEYGAIAQAKNFYSVAMNSQLPPSLDYELTTGSPGNVRKCLIEIERLFGRIPILYSNKRFWFNWLLPWTDEYEKWVASYTLWPRPTMPVGWNSWLLWQYTDRYPCKKLGIRDSLGCDMNRFNGDEAAFAAWTKQPAPPIEAPASTAPPLRVRLNTPMRIRINPDVLTGAILGQAAIGIYDVTKRIDVGTDTSWARIDRGWVCVMLNGKKYGEWL